MKTQQNFRIVILAGVAAIWLSAVTGVGIVEAGRKGPSIRMVSVHRAPMTVTHARVTQRVPTQPTAAVNAARTRSHVIRPSVNQTTERKFSSPLTLEPSLNTPIVVFNPALEKIRDSFHMPPGFDHGMDTPLPGGVDPSRIPGYGCPDTEEPDIFHDREAWERWIRREADSDISDRPHLWTLVDQNKALHWGSSERNPILRLYMMEGSRKGGTGTEGNGKGGPNTNSGTTGEKPKDTGNDPVAEGTVKDNENNGGGDDGNDPDEIRNYFRDSALNPEALREMASMGDGSRTTGNSGQNGLLPRKRGRKSFLERVRDGFAGEGTNREPEDGTDPAAYPSRKHAAGINFGTSHAMSPSVDDRQRGTGPRGPIGPVATSSASPTMSLDVGRALTAAMSDPMGSPSTDDRQSGKGPKGPIGPVADQMN